jgi:muconolactone delta-isomerase
MEKPVNLLWTSGADSTFRLLELLLIQKREVQPYYIVDRQRKSFNLEKKAMEKIKQLIFKKDPNAKRLIRPTIFQELDEIKPNPFISEQYKRLASIDHLGAQYEWLPKFAEDAKLNDLELSITSGEHSDSYFRRFLRPSLIKEKSGEYYNYRLKDNPDNPDLTLFKYFRFPIIEWTKIDMRRIAKESNFLDIMEHTWFCHYPLNNQPCGICNPCRIAIKEGMSRRIPLTGLLRNLWHYKIKPKAKGA